MSPSRAAAWVLTWLVVVAIGSTLVWTVISRAGEQVVSSSDPLVVTNGPKPTRSPSPSSSSPPSSPASSSSPAGPAPERRTWQGVGGLVVAQCVGSAISRVSLLPDDGYAVELKEDGPEELEVEFEGREDESGSQSSVSATCVDGVPVFQSQVESDD
jgi:hypothetical protein